MPPSPSLTAISTSASIATTPSDVWDPSPTPTSVTSQASTAVPAIPYWEASPTHSPEIDTFNPSLSNTVNLKSIGQLVKRGDSDGFRNSYDNSNFSPGTGGPNTQDSPSIDQPAGVGFTPMTRGQTAGTFVGGTVLIALAATGVLGYRRLQRKRAATIREAAAWPAYESNRDVELGLDPQRSSASHPHQSSWQSLSSPGLTVPSQSLPRF